MQLNSMESQLKYFLLKTQLDQIKVRTKISYLMVFLFLKEKNNKLPNHKKERERKELKLRQLVLKN